jgi:phosphohistidine swiveling domain-containing protein
MKRSMVTLRNNLVNDEHEIGGKAGNLVELIRAGLPVPDCWVVPGEIFRDHLIFHGQEKTARAVFADGDESACSELRQCVLSMELQADLLESLSSLPDAPFAVRSSASVEDGAQGSYSGLFSTCLGIGRRELESAVKTVWGSAFTPEVLAYHRQVAPGSGYPLMAVLLMPLLDARLAGVAFSADPANGDPFRIVVTACRGLGTRIVEGSEAGVRYILDLDALDIVEMSAGHQIEGDFVQSDGHIATRTVNAEVTLSEDQLRELGGTVRAIDEILDGRVDVEFAFTDRGLEILQARQILGLPFFFPENPVESGDAHWFLHCARTDPLPPFIREVFTAPLEHPRIPRPPWPLEVESVLCRHGRVFGRSPQEPDYIYQEDIEDQNRDRTFLHKMEALDDPEDHFRPYCAWTEDAYERVVPRIRQDCTRLLSLSEEERAALSSRRFSEVFGEALDLERQAGVFYVSSSWVTAYYVDMAQKLLKDWIGFPNWRKAEQLSMDLIQGAPSLTHERDAELQQIALGHGDLESFVRRWGYSYLVRDEQLYFDLWKSWREDPQPLRQAIEQMQHAVDQRSIEERLVESRNRAEEILARTTRRFEAADQRQCAQRSRIFTACVHFGRAHFRMKDDRDLIWSHAQAALRWILLGAARRLMEKGAVASDREVFLFTPRELLDFFSSGESTIAGMSDRAAERRRKQARLARYTLPSQPVEEAPGPPAGGVMEGVPTGPGIAEGKAHIVREETALEDLASLDEGDILVFIGEGKVGLTMFFPQIAGLVYSNGNGLCHESNLCRELGKPAVVCVGENAELIEEGELLRIDGGEGYVTLLEKDLV